MKRYVMGVGLTAVLVLQYATPEAAAQNAAPGSTGSTAREDRCTRNLKHIYKLIRAYQHHSGGLFPATIDDLRQMTRDQALFRCGTDGGVDLVSDPTKQSFEGLSPSAIAIVVERPTRRRDVHILFYDGAVRVMTNEQLDALRKRGYVQ